MRRNQLTESESKRIFGKESSEGLEAGRSLVDSRKCGQDEVRAEALSEAAFVSQGSVDSAVTTREGRHSVLLASSDEPRDAATHPTMYRTVPHNKGLSGSKCQ